MQTKVVAFNDMFQIMKKIFYIASCLENFRDINLRLILKLYSTDKRKITFSLHITFLSLSLVQQPFGPWPLFQFLNPIHSL
jgi:hypothetical protein